MALQGLKKYHLLSILALFPTLYIIQDEAVLFMNMTSPSTISVFAGIFGVAETTWKIFTGVFIATFLELLILVFARMISNTRWYLTPQKIFMIFLFLVSFSASSLQVVTPYLENISLFISRGRLIQSTKDKLKAVESDVDYYRNIDKQRINAARSTKIKQNLLNKLYTLQSKQKVQYLAIIYIVFILAFKFSVQISGAYLFYIANVIKCKENAPPAIKKEDTEKSQESLSIIRSSSRILNKLKNKGFSSIEEVSNTTNIKPQTLKLVLKHMPTIVNLVV